jgi:hypothetical protein
MQIISEEEVKEITEKLVEHLKARREFSMTSDMYVEQIIPLAEDPAYAHADWDDPAVVACLTPSRVAYAAFGKRLSELDEALYDLRQNQKQLKQAREKWKELQGGHVDG